MLIHIDQRFRQRLESVLRAQGVLDHALLNLRVVEPNFALLDWLKKGLHGDMTWMERTAAKRSDVRAAFPEFPTAVILSLSYYQPQSLAASRKNRISLYAQGRDYHKVLNKMLKRTWLSLKDSYPSLTARWYVDTGPVSEKYLASLTSLGWVGKNTNLVSARHGSFFFLGVLFLGAVCEDFSPATDHCGTCVRCLVHCPTGALFEPYKIDSKLCLSYQTIEKKTSSDESLSRKESNWLYGCDDCQTCCPYNRFSKLSPVEDFKPRKNYELDYFLDLDEEGFKKEFEGSPIRRIGYEKFMENLLLTLRQEGSNNFKAIQKLKKRTKSQRIKKRIQELFNEAQESEEVEEKRGGKLTELQNYRNHRNGERKK